MRRSFALPHDQRHWRRYASDLQGQALYGAPHAAQSLIVFGFASVALFVCGGASAVAFFLATPTFQMLQSIGNAIWLAAVLLWLFLLVKAWQGETWRVPIVGSLAARLAQA